MRRTSPRCVVVVAAVAVGAPALGDVAFWQTVDIPPNAINSDPVLANMQTFDLMITATTGRWGAGALRATLPAGFTFYHHPLGSDTRPHPGIVGVIPALGFDTYVASPVDPAFVVGGFPFGSWKQMENNVVSVAWGSLENHAPGTYQVARFTFPQGVLPTIDPFSYLAQLEPATSHQISTLLPSKLPQRSWIADADGDWNDPANWSGNSVPAGGRVLLDAGGPEVRTITHASGDKGPFEIRSFERIELTGGNLSAYTTEVHDVVYISGGTYRPQGFHHLTGTGVLEVSNNGTVAITGFSMLAIGPDVTMRGTGGVVTAGEGAFIHNRGTIHVPADQSLSLPGGMVSTGQILADAGGVLTITGALLQSGMIGGHGRIRLLGNLSVNQSATKVGSGPLRTDGQLNTTDARLDLVAGSVINDYTGDSPLEAIRASIITGYNHGAWDGPGINSSTAAADDSFAVGYAEAAALFTAFPATYEGEEIDDTTVIVRLTRAGDADLDGVVNLSDFNRLAANFGSTSAVWSDGDFNYDGIVNLADFNRMAGNFGLAASGTDAPTPADWSALAAAVPEPGMQLALLGLAAVFARRRRQ